jgi:hypothetical protein
MAIRGLDAFKLVCKGIRSMTAEGVRQAFALPSSVVTIASCHAGDTGEAAGRGRSRF